MGHFKKCRNINFKKYFCLKQCLASNNEALLWLWQYGMTFEDIFF